MCTIDYIFKKKKLFQSNTRLLIEERGGEKVQSGLMPGSSQSIYLAHELTKIKKFMV